MEITPEIVAIIVSLVGALVYLSKKLIEMLGGKLESIFRAINKQAESIEALTKELKKGYDELRDHHTTLKSHMKDTQVHVTPEDREVLKDLKK